MNSRFRLAFAIVAGLALAGALLRPLERRVWTAHRAAQPALRSGAADAGPGVALALLGGFRAFAADLVWLQAYAAWERRDTPATTRLLRLATDVDPRPLSFWLNGARILAYDLPAWMSPDGAPVQAAAREPVRQALRRLETAETFHPGEPLLWIERAGIELHALHDPAAAAESYRRAALLPGAPYFAARLHAELLRRLGRKREALAWLVAVHPTLPGDDAAAAADLVLARIGDIERELGLPPDERYRAPEPPGS